MHWKEWLKSAAVASGAGAASAVTTMIMDPTKFNLSNGLKDEALMVLQGAVVGLACLFIRSPMGTAVRSYMADMKVQSNKDAELLAELRKDYGTLPAKPGAKENGPGPPI